MAGYPEYYKISYTSGERVLTVCDNPKLMPVLMLKKNKSLNATKREMIRDVS